MRLSTWILVGAMSAQTSAQTVLYEHEGEQPFDFLGAAVAGAGDVDADGFDDVIAGALGYSLGARLHSCRRQSKNLNERSATPPSRRLATGRVDRTPDSA